jgi:hypothetical protein
MAWLPVSGRDLQAERLSAGIDFDEQRIVAIEQVQGIAFLYKERRPAIIARRRVISFFAKSPERSA